jgi:hydrogenase nickel incorporation protein HypA/HybF
MHELSIAMSILEVVAEEAESHGVKDLAGIHVRLGPLSGVVKDALLSAFDCAREDSPFPRADLMIEEAPILIRCGKCASDREVIALHDLRCARCGGGGEVVAGNELEITALEVMT